MLQAAISSTFDTYIDGIRNRVGLEGATSSEIFHFLLFLLLHFLLPLLFAALMP